jgi:hypothetical protein
MPATRVREDRIRTLVSTVAIGPSVPDLAAMPHAEPQVAPTFYGRAILGEGFPEVRPVELTPTR